MQLPFDKKALTTIIVVLIVMVSLASVIIVHETQGNKDTSNSGAYNILARANTEGSGVYISPDVVTAKGGLDKFYTVNGDEYVVNETNKAAWGGLIMGTPGAATIQHVQLQQIAEKAGLIFTLYQDGQATDDDHMYYIATMANASTVLGYSGQLDGGILWEPQYSKIISSDKYQQLALTNNLFPGHTCCTVVGNVEYISSHKDVTERFLAAYMKGMTWVQNALANPSGDDYKKLVQICVEVTGGSIDEATIKNALGNITYVGTDADGTLNALKADVAELADSLVSMGLLKHNISDLGFNYASQFANAFVDDAYVKGANERLAAADPTLKTGASAIITVAVISGDIHQIAIHVANELGYFSDYNLTVNLSSATNGPGVAVAMQNGTAQFGLVGAPPATSTAINSMLITA